MPTQQQVQDYYGRQLQRSSDLRTDACCDAGALPAWLLPLLAGVHPAVVDRYYGCGLVCPPLLEGCRVLDLGCGAGRDLFVLAQLVGPSGSVVGIDMTPEQLAVARDHLDWHAERFGYANVSVREGLIERLDELGLEPAGFDVVVSNCVLNLSTDKGAVLAGVKRLLKPGGEFYFADVYADRRLPEAARRDPVLYGECLGGALYWNDFLRLCRGAGFTDPRLVTDRPLAIGDGALQALVGEARFYSATYRLFAIDGLEDACEDHGQAVRYRGTIPGSPHRLDLDAHHRIEAGRWLPVCGNTFRMLTESRFAPHVEGLGDQMHHFGLFPGCGSAIPFDQGAATTVASPAAPGAPVGRCC